MVMMWEMEDGRVGWQEGHWHMQAAAARKIGCINGSSIQT